MPQVIINAANGCRVASQVAVAHTLWERTRGLLGAPPLQPGQALVIERCHAVHTFGMTYPIDVAFIDRNMIVLNEIHSMPPCRMSRVVWGAHQAIELPAGSLSRTRTYPGHRLVLESVSGS